MQSHLARAGVAIFAVLMAITLVSEQQAAGRALVAGSATGELPALHELVTIGLAHAAIVAVAGSETAAASVDPAIDALAVPAAGVLPAASVPSATVVGAPAQGDAIVLASWYGPGFYGNRTACGQVYTPEILGVANPTLPCGTRLTLSYGSRSVTVAVIDRGPYIAGRTLDLSNATKLALGCSDLCTLRMQLAP